VSHCVKSWRRAGVWQFQCLPSKYIAARRRKVYVTRNYISPRTASEAAINILKAPYHCALISR